jgi:hypothetical protein
MINTIRILETAVLVLLIRIYEVRHSDNLGGHDADAIFNEGQALKEY